MYLARFRSIYNTPFRRIEEILRPVAVITNIKSISYTEIFNRVKRIKPYLFPKNVLS